MTPRADFTMQPMKRAAAGIFIVILAALVYLGLVQSARAEIKIPSPHWLERTQVAQEMIINGLPSVVEYFTADQGPERVLEYYRREWGPGDAAQPGYKETEVKPWRIISRVDGHWLLTVQVRKRDSFGAEGYLAAADTKKFNGGKARDVPAMQGSKVINDLVSSDPGREGRTLLLFNEFSPESNSVFYRNYYEERGWGKMMDLSRNGAQVLVFKRSGQEAHLVISRELGPTTIVMNLVKQ